MAKHPHRLLLINNKTWKCTLPGCNFFVHTGLAHVLEGKNAVCWECGEVFIVDAASLREEMPKCPEHRFGANPSRPSDDDVDFDGFQQIMTAKHKNGVNSLGEINPDKIKNMQMLGLLPKYIPAKYFEIHEPEPDEIEVIEAEEVHAPDCEIHEGLLCTCGLA